MNLRNFALLCATPLLAAAAHAQAGLYATISAQRLGNIQYTNGSTTATNGQVNPLGGTFGLYYDFKNLNFGPIRLGADARGIITRTPRGVQPLSNGSGAHLYSVLGGVRASIHTPIRLLRPYVEGAAGLGRTDYGQLAPGSGSAGGTTSSLYKAFEYHGYVGLDLAVSPIIDVRAFELGAGGLSGSSPISHTYSLNSISAGIVFHLPR